MRVHYQKGLTLFLNRQYKLAETEFRQELTENPDYSSAHAMLSMSMLQQSKFDQALRSAKEAIRLAPDLAYGHYALASANYRKGKIDVANREIKEALRLDPNDSFYYARAAEIKMVERQLKQALEYADAGLKVNPNSLNCLVDRANILVKLDRLDAAEVAADLALQIDPEEPSAHIGKGLILLHKSQITEAFNHYREALRLAPHSNEARRGEALTMKARYPFYNQALSLSLWVGRLDKRILVVAFVVLLLSPAKHLPGLIVLLLAAGNSFFNLLLRFDPVGRSMLTAQEIKYCNYGLGITALVVIAAVLAITQARLDKSADGNFHAQEKVRTGRSAEANDKEQVLFAHYLPIVQKVIKQNWHPPKQKGTSRVTVLFDTTKDGQLKKLKIGKSSGDQEVDESALKAVRASVPFPKFPPGSTDDFVSIEFTFDYNVWKRGQKSSPEPIGVETQNKP